jgi:RimJ/RimL family protein N-acetyltransferase
MTGVVDHASIVNKFNKFVIARYKLPLEGAILFVVKSNSEIPMGYITLMCNWEKTKEWELGYSFLPTYFHHGYAYESVKRVIRFAFEELKIHKLMAFVNAENIPSIKLLERLNMRKEGQMREARLINDRWADEFVYAMIESDFIYASR